MVHPRRGHCLRRALPVAVLVAGLAWSLAAGLALADNGPHVSVSGSTSLSISAESCAGCHRAHPGQGTSLTVSSTQLGLCYSCHGSAGIGATTDVQDGQQYLPLSGRVPGAVQAAFRGTTIAGALRGGGFQSAAINAAPSSLSDPIGALVSPVATTSRHDVGTTGMAWGAGDVTGIPNDGASTALACSSCHNPHGNGRYRVLNPTPTGAYTGPYTGFAPDLADHRSAMSGVDLPDAAVYTYTTTDYWQPADPLAPAYIARVSDWCASCHTRYLAVRGAGSRSSGDAIYALRHPTDGTATATTDGEVPSCVQCHVAHGSNAAVGDNSRAVPWPGGPSRGADSSLLRMDDRGVCQRCHHK